jgi:hypothetical protein
MTMDITKAAAALGRLGGSCPSCGSLTKHTDNTGTYCGNENCRRPSVTVSVCECGSIVLHRLAFLFDACPTCGAIRWEKQFKNLSEWRQWYFSPEEIALLEKADEKQKGGQ